MATQPFYRGASAPRAQVTFLSGQPHVLFPDHYAWLVLVSALDLMLSWVILSLGGQEVNVLADAILQQRGLHGLIVFKFCLLVLVVVMCELVGRRRRATGRSLAEWAIAFSAIPVAVAMIQLAFRQWAVVGG